MGGCGAAVRPGRSRQFRGLPTPAGSYAHTVMANGSWTAAHLRSLWRGAVVVVFPPCDTATLQAPL